MWLPFCRLPRLFLSLRRLCGKDDNDDDSGKDDSDDEDDSEEESDYESEEDSDWDEDGDLANLMSQLPTQR